ncbi:hypothetical protein SARC_08260 [Sphaeroforma arctica JP610]|uniref:Cathepsin propeptide inhibitor domain-containing protein n=1 Tax=Sphaeroforma arctica JP610 TaxID=667725 RepID=A0A0L0FR90_9EUKA|nr:hypothetical protein SARC_08260 [Sphaeroforma arctica JP610]KNC79337.1 hypothetical protein SARC_08260 [Sphaeroforma arctica JP610]|eukprot:XP_014153239.1 hypothetical protein SARC_08260 [Sphaeroforma arctica JP610]
MGFAQQPNTFGGLPGAKNINNATNINATRIKETQLVKVEMLEDWPHTCAITCYAAVSSYERRRTNILEDDWSVEEIRWEAYKANSGSGGSKWEAYCKNMEAMTNDLTMKRKAIYENPDLALNRFNEQPQHPNPPNCFGTMQATTSNSGQIQGQFGSRIGGTPGFGAGR